MTNAERFWQAVNKQGPLLVPKLGLCWVWTKAVDADGYGAFSIKNRSIKAHRYAWFLAHGYWPTPCGLHKCDNPSCVREAHLFEGTPKDNTQDLIVKGRRQNTKGSKHPLAKLNDSQVIQIRETYAAGAVTQQNLAEQYNISRPNVSLIVNHKSWCA